MSTAYTPKLWFDADYVSDGRILLLPIKGSGRCNISLSMHEKFPRRSLTTVKTKFVSDAYKFADELETASDVKFTPQMKNGEEYWIINQFLVKFTPKKVTMYFDGILGNSDQGKSFGKKNITLLYCFTCRSLRWGRQMGTMGNVGGLFHVLFATLDSHPHNLYLVWDVFIINYWWVKVACPQANP